jgi:hypothetical protein
VSRRAIALLALAFAGCGAAQKQPSEPAPQQAPVTHEDIESEYHKPPSPARSALGGTITLTGTNIGIRQKVTVTGVSQTGKWLAVQLRLENTGITNYEGPLRSAVLRHGSKSRKVAVGAHAACSNGFDAETVFIAVGESASGCLLFPAGDAPPSELQLALEIVPVSEGGVWSLEG